jgi:hypothetical protein
MTQTFGEFSNMMKVAQKLMPEESKNKHQVKKYTFTYYNT